MTPINTFYDFHCKFIERHKNRFFSVYTARVHLVPPLTQHELFLIELILLIAVLVLMLTCLCCRCYCIYYEIKLLNYVIIKSISVETDMMTSYNSNIDSILPVKVYFHLNIVPIPIINKFTAVLLVQYVCFSYNCLKEKR